MKPLLLNPKLHNVIHTTNFGIKMKKLCLPKYGQKSRKIALKWKQWKLTFFLCSISSRFARALNTTLEINVECQNWFKRWNEKKKKRIGKARYALGHKPDISQFIFLKRIHHLVSHVQKHTRPDCDFENYKFVLEIFLIFFYN